MSDTVKLIIEIPKEMMKALEVGNFGSKYNPYDVCWLVKNGIPLDKIRKEVMEYIDDLDIAYEICGVFDNIGKAESEDKAENKGEWIEKEVFDGDTAYECSECGELFCLIDGTPADNLYNFCPNCGADMRGKE